MKLLQQLDQIIEDPRKTKEAIRFLESKGLLDPDAVAMWEVEQSNRDYACTHQLPNGKTALYDAAGITSCSLCGADDYPGNTL